MDRFIAAVVGLIRHEDGQDLLEYALVAALIAIVAAGAVKTLGDTINTTFWQAIAQLNF